VGTSVTSQKQQSVADPGYVDLAKKYELKAYVVLSRELALHEIATATCLTDRVYWALILTSCCGPYVREGCFLRNADTGRLVMDEKNQVFPLRAKHLLQILKLDSAYRGKIHQSLKKLVEQGRMEVRGEDKIWYPLLDPTRLAEETAKANCKEKCYFSGNISLPSFLRKAIPDEFVSQVATSPVTAAWLKDLKQRYQSDLKALRDSYADETVKHFFDDRIIIEEDIEDIEEDERGGVETTSSVENPEQPRSPPPPSPVVIPKPQPEPVTAVVVSKDPAHKLFEVFCFIMQGCGRPVAVKCVRECRAEFFKYPPTTQQRIIEDANLRFKGDNPRFITAPLKYLCSEIWDTEPITRPLFSPPARKSKGEEAMDRVMARAIQRDREEGPLR